MPSTKNSIYLTDEVQQYLDEQCKIYGMGKSAFVSMVLTEHRQQQDALHMFNNMDSYLSRLEGIKPVNK